MTSVLLADDNHQIRKFLRTILEAWSDLHVCGEAVDGVEAVEKAQQLNPDLIVLDLAMPRMNGLEAARTLRSMHTVVPIILLTLYGNTITPAEAKAAGVDAVFSKEDVPGFMKHIESTLHSMERPS